MVDWLLNLQTSVLGYIYTGHGFFKVTPVQYAFLCFLGALVVGFFYLVFFKWLKPLVWRAESNQVAARSVFYLAFLFYAVVTTWTTVLYPPVADEPHYLLIAHSLVKDGDIDLANNFAAKDYKAFYPGDPMDMHGFPDAQGRLYSLHAPGVSFLIALPYLLGGRFGAQLFMNFLAALVIANIFLLCREGGCSTEGAMTAALFGAFSSPLLTYASLVYTEIPAALITVFAFRKTVFQRNYSPGEVLAVAIGLGFMPWLHLKYGLLGLILAVFLLLNLKGQRLLTALVLLLGVGDLLLYLLFYSGHYGWSLTLHGPTWRADAPGIFSWDLARGFLGLLFDRDFGLITYGPVFLFIFIGLFLMRREEPRAAFATAVLCIPHFLFYGFTVPECWSGAAAPGRVLLPVVPVLMLLAARAGEERIFKGLWRKAGVLGLALGFLLSCFPFLRFTTGREKFLAAVAGRLSFDPFFFLPRLFDGKPGSVVLAFFYLAVLLAVSALYVRLKERINFSFKSFRGGRE